MPATIPAPEDAPARRVLRGWTLLFTLLPVLAAFAVHRDASDQRAAWAWAAAVVGAAGTWAVVWPRRWRPGLHAGAAWLGASWFAAGLWLAASRWWGVLPGASWYESSRLLGGLACAALAWLLARRCGLAAAIVGVVLAGCLFVAVAAIAGGGWNAIDHQLRVTGWLGYWNATALLCAWLATGATVTLDRFGTRPARIAGVLLTIVAGLGLAVTASRAALAAFIVVVVGRAVLRRQVAETVSALVSLVAALVPVVAVAAHAPALLVLLVAPLAWAAAPSRAPLDAVLARAGSRWGRRVRTPRARPVVLIASLVVAAALVVVLVKAVHDFTSTTTATAQTSVSRLASASGDHRWTWWKEAARAFWHRPILGGGGELFRVYHLMHRQDLSSVADPHSLPLQLLDNGGIVLGLLGLGALAGLIRLTWAVRAQPLASLAAGLVWVCLIQALVDWTLQFPVVIVCVSLLVGVVAAAADPRGGPRLAPPGSPRRRATGAVVIAAGLLALVPACAALLESSAENSVDRHPATAFDLARVSFTLVPDPTSFASATFALQRAHGTARAQRWLDAHIHVVQDEPAAWTTVGAFAIHSTEHRRQLWLQGTRRVDPLGYAVTYT